MLANMVLWSNLRLHMEALKSKGALTYTSFTICTESSFLLVVACTLPTKLVHTSCHFVAIVLPTASILVSILVSVKLQQHGIIS